ncbi:MAG: hypothetical protein ACAH83_08350 [Alphaproteobacteria bacterium]
MTAQTVEEALEGVYASLQNDNEGIDVQIATLKAALAGSGKKAVEIDTSRLAQNNRAGRKMMQSYFRKRGVEVVFAEK